MAMAKKAVDSTIKRILIHTAEIMLSIVLLIEIFLPVIFVAPVWIEQVVFGTPSGSAIFNPIAWFGVNGTIVVLLALALVSMLIGYGSISVMYKSKSDTKTTEKSPAEETTE